MIQSVHENAPQAVAEVTSTNSLNLAPAKTPARGIQPMASAHQIEQD